MAVMFECGECTDCLLMCMLLFAVLSDYQCDNVIKPERVHFRPTGCILLGISLSFNINQNIFLLILYHGAGYINHHVNPPPSNILYHLFS